MSSIAIYLIAELTAIICASGAVYLAAHGIDGWGWFLAVTLISGVSSYREIQK
jgi:hypothetical protein